VAHEEVTSQQRIRPYAPKDFAVLKYDSPRAATEIRSLIDSHDTTWRNNFNTLTALLDHCSGICLVTGRSLQFWLTV